MDGYYPIYFSGKGIINKISLLGLAFGENMEIACRFGDIILTNNSKETK
jgi:hypothetical protein